MVHRRKILANIALQHVPVLPNRNSRYGQRSMLTKPLSGSKRIRNKTRLKYILYNSRQRMMYNTITKGSRRDQPRFWIVYPECPVITGRIAVVRQLALQPANIRLQLKQKPRDVGPFLFTPRRRQR